MTLVKTDVPMVLEREVDRMRNRVQRHFEEPFGFDLRLPLLDEKEAGAKEATHHLWERERHSEDRAAEAGDRAAGLADETDREAVAISTQARADTRGTTPPTPTRRWDRPDRG